MYWKKVALLPVLLSLGWTASYLGAQTNEVKDVLLKRINEQFILTQMSADGADVVKPGSVVTLHKDGFQMCSVQAKVPLTSFYKDGKLSAAKFAWSLVLGLAQPGVPSSSIPIRTFVANEKFWVAAITIEKNNEVVLKVYSDPYQDVRYYAQIAFPFNKKSAAPVDDLLNTIAEIVTPDLPNTSPEPVAASSLNRAQNASPQQVLAPVGPSLALTDAPPPAPKTISLGQTKDQVVAIFGPPQKVVQLGAKEIDYYPDMKVTFDTGKVADVQ